MPIIKGPSGKEAPAPAADHAGGTGVRVQEILEEAEIAAAGIIADAKEAAEQMVAQGAESGQQEGFQQAEHMREEIRGMEQRMLNEVEGEVVRTALKIAEDILGEELKAREEAIVDLAAAALQEASNAREVFLRVAPVHAPLLRKHKKRLVDSLSVAKEVDVREDKKVAPGGVLVQTESGVVDATLETQLAEIARVLGA